MGLFTTPSTIGLAPFSPPHVIEKLSLLWDNNLVKSIDWFDLLLHGSSWVLLLLKTISIPIIKIIEK